MTQKETTSSDGLDMNEAADLASKKTRETGLQYGATKGKGSLDKWEVKRVPKPATIRGTKVKY